MERKNSQSLPVIRQSSTVTFMEPIVEWAKVRDKEGNVVCKNGKEIQTSNYGALEMRVKYRALQGIQHIFDGVRVGELLPLDINNLSLEDLTVQIDMSQITNSDHYADVDKAAKNLMDLYLSYKDSQGNSHELHIIEDRIRKRGSRFMNVIFTRSFIKCLGETSGWTSFYDADTVCSLSSVHSMRMYELISQLNSESRNIRLPFEQLKAVLGLKHLYRGPQGVKNFDNKILKKVKAELDSKCPYSFTYECVHVEDDWFYSLSVYHIPKNEKPDSEKNRLLRQISFGMDPDARVYLTSKSLYGFTPQEIQNNNSVFMEFEKVTGQRLAMVLQEKWQEAHGKDNPKGWIVSTLRGMMERPPKV